MSSSEETVTFYYRAYLKRGPQWAWREVYSAGEGNVIEFPPVTIGECYVQAYDRGRKKAVFYRKGKRIN
jgi:hypothetical protein